MVTSVSPPLSSSSSFISLPPLLPRSPECCPAFCSAIACHFAGGDTSSPRLICWYKYHTRRFRHLLPWFPILLHSPVCLLIWFSSRKFPWCTAVRPPLCLQQQHLPQASPSLQQPQPTRFANLQLCFLKHNSESVLFRSMGFCPSHPFVLFGFFVRSYLLLAYTFPWDPQHSLTSLLPMLRKVLHLHFQY